MKLGKKQLDLLMLIHHLNHEIVTKCKSLINTNVVLPDENDAVFTKNLKDAINVKL